MSKFELFLWNVLIGKDKSVPVFTTRRGSFFTALGIRRSPQARAACGIETPWRYYRYLARTLIKSHKHVVERAARRGF